MEGDVPEYVEGVGLGGVGRRLEMIGLEVRGDALRDRPRQCIAKAAGHALQQGGGEGGVAEQPDRRRITGRTARNQAAAVERAGDAGEQHPFVELRRRPLRAALVEPGQPEEGGDRAMIVEAEPQLLAGLLAALVRRGGDHRQRDTVRVEDLDPVKLAIGADRGQGEIVGKLGADDPGHAPDLAIEAERRPALEARAGRERRSRIGAAVAEQRPGHRIGRVEAPRLEGGAVRMVLLVIAENVYRDAVRGRPVESAADRAGVDRVEVRAAEQIVDIAVAVAVAAGDAEGGGIAHRHV